MSYLWYAFRKTTKSLPLLENEPQLLGCLIQSLVYQAPRYKIWYSLSGIGHYYGVSNILTISGKLYPEMRESHRIILLYMAHELLNLASM
jgi:hypothetical protein